MAKPIVLQGACTINMHSSKKVNIEHPYHMGQAGKVVAISADTNWVTVDFGLPSTPVIMFPKEAIVMT